MEKNKRVEEYERTAMRYYEDGKLDECVNLTAALLKEDPYLMGSLVLLLSSYRKELFRTGDHGAGARQITELLGRAFYDYNT